MKNNRLERITEIEGLRAILAFWIILDHLLGNSKFSVQILPGILRLLRAGWYAVDIFIIISGFVIFLLIDTKKEKYNAYIIRRFFRLFPLFFFTTILYIVLFKKYQIDHFWYYFVSYISMLHGIYVEGILHQSPLIFNGPSWSISLEWQFYIIAPLLYIATKRKSTIITSIILVIFLYQFCLFLPTVSFGSYLPFHCEYFFVGIISYFLWKKLRQSNLFNNDYLTLCSFGIFFVFFPHIKNLIQNNYQFQLGNWIPLFFWFIFMAIILDSPGNNFSINKIIRLFLNSRIMQYLGKISYSLYLNHYIVLECIDSFLLKKYFPGITYYYKFSILLITVIYH